MPRPFVANPREYVDCREADVSRIYAAGTNDLNDSGERADSTD